MMCGLRSLLLMPNIHPVLGMRGSDLDHQAPIILRT
jgi:hypothetical protein